MPSSLILLCGPPLPGRWTLARALVERLGARRLAECAPDHARLLTQALGDEGLLCADGDLATAEERRALLTATASSRQLLIDWRCHEELAERDCFHRYASRPGLLARTEWQRYQRDAARREPVEDRELPGRVLQLDAARPLDENLERVVEQLPPRSRPPLPEFQPRVLVVEDDPDQRALLADVLHELGFAVELAPDAGVALALLDDGAHVDLMISDQQMPGMSGIELTRELRRRHPRVRTILLTAFGDERTCRDAVDADAVTLLAKPLRVCDLERVLDEATARSCSPAP